MNMTASLNIKEIKPQPGPQEQFLSTSADIAIYGGAAGAGKSFALEMEPLRHIENKDFGAVCFRRTSPEITSEGGLWDTSFKLYSSYDAEPVQSPKHHWKFESGAKITFSHLQYEKNLTDWQGSQIPLILFDELQHFTERMFFYMLSRNRTTCGVRPYIRATCNPDPDSWLCDFLIKAGYIHGKDADKELQGYPIKEMSGVIKWFIRLNNIVYWANTKEDLIKEHGKEVTPKSFTFIPATIEDNQILLEANPDYISNLNALLEYEMIRLMKGNWFARPSAGELFKRMYFQPVSYEDYKKLKVIESMRYWDRAATLPNDNNPDPDYTAGVRMDLCEDKNFYITHVLRDRLEPGDVEKLILTITEQDDSDTIVGLEQEPGASGKTEVIHYQNKITNRDVKTFPKSGKNKSKLACWKPLARAAKNGKIFIVKAPWNEMFLSEAESVTDGTQQGHDDMIDAVSGAFNYLQDKADSAFYVVDFL